MHRLNDGSFCKRYASAGTRFCSHHQGSYAHLQHDDPVDIHPLARLTTPEDIFDLLRETLNAARLGRSPPGQAFAVGYLAAEWRKSYQELTILQRNMALHRQILPGLMLDETAIESERAEAPHPLPIRVDEGATIAHMTNKNNPAVPPLEHVSAYPGWIEQEGRRKGDRLSSIPPAPSIVEGSAVEAQPAPVTPPQPHPVTAPPALPHLGTLSEAEGQPIVPSVSDAGRNGRKPKPHPASL